MSPFWKDKIYKTLLGINSVVSSFLRAILLATLVVFCVPCFVIIVGAVLISTVVVDWQDRTKEKIGVWAYGENKTIHE